MSVVPSIGDLSLGTAGGSVAPLDPALLDPALCQTPGMMTHPGLPAAWVWGVGLSALLIFLWGTLAPARHPHPHRHPSGGLWRAQALRWPAVSAFAAALRAALQPLWRTPWLLLALRVVVAALFLMVIFAGLFGTPIPERNLATVLTWNLWWTGLVFAVFLVGSAWCAICPWEAIAGWLTRWHAWGRGRADGSLGWRVPRALRGVWPATAMFIALTWLELGLGITTNPYATALLALFMVVLASASALLFERSAMCRWFCPVGRTVGVYSTLSPVALRPLDPMLCARCETLECYHGDARIAPCPTHQVMGRMRDNIDCTSCGNCTQSCPEGNVTWQWRVPGHEAVSTGRPRVDLAWLMVVLLALTSFHGLTMMPFWEPTLRGFARLIGDSGQLLWSFSAALGLALAVPLGLYALGVALTRRLLGPQIETRRVFAALAFACLPPAFAYHLAHNLNHLLRETGDLPALLANPLGRGALPMTEAEHFLYYLNPSLPQGGLFLFQAVLLVAGLWLAARIVRRRVDALIREGGARATRDATRAPGAPMLGFVTVATLYHLWLLAHPMVMRM
ncbi:MAG: 4Fe-4S binding protein [Chromatiales bacterium]|nr:4Fe-4S binding protein [Gammaproteobacteria bacterium]MCP5352965.1 4Fe-4S binding protein [Chromatiales bacterium]